MCDRFWAVLGFEGLIKGGLCEPINLIRGRSLGALLCTFGVVWGLLLSGHVQFVDGVCEIHSPASADVLQRFPVPASAIVFRYVVSARDQESWG